MSHEGDREGSLQNKRSTFPQGRNSAVRVSIDQFFLSEQFYYQRLREYSGAISAPLLLTLQLTTKARKITQLSPSLTPTLGSLKLRNFLLAIKTAISLFPINLSLHSRVINYVLCCAEKQCASSSRSRRGSNLSHHFSAQQSNRNI